jgi:hypothetical protein
MFFLRSLPFDASDIAGTVRSLRFEHDISPAEIEKVFKLQLQPISLTEIVGYLKPEPAAAPTKPAKQKQTA